MKVVRNIFFGLVIAGVMVFALGLSFAETETTTAVPAETPVVASEATPATAPAETPVVASEATPATAPAETPVVAPEATPATAPAETPVVAPEATPAETKAVAPLAAQAVANDFLAEHKPRTDPFGNILRDSAAALQATNPDLAMKLTDIVIGISKFRADSNIKKVNPSTPEFLAERDARIQLYKDAATALQATNPALAKGLMDLTVPRQKAETQIITEVNNGK
jgi:hypothetical protein